MKKIALIIIGILSAFYGYSQCPGISSSGTTKAKTTKSCYDTVVVASSLNIVTADTITVTGSLIIGYSPTLAGNADNLLNIRGAGSSTGMWRGRITAGGDNIAFLMGEYNGEAWLGAHNAALSAWAPMHINPDGGQGVYIGNDQLLVDPNGISVRGNALVWSPDVITIGAFREIHVGTDLQLQEWNGSSWVLVSSRSSIFLADQYKLSALNTAPSGASDTGTTGEIRIDASFIYICTATNTWKRVAIATW